MIEQMLSTIPIKTTPSPGPGDIAIGDTDLGYYGLVDSADLINGDALAAAGGLTVGVSINSTAGWLKFAYKGKTLFISKKPLRYSLSWNQINAAGLIKGTKIITILGNNYKLRLMKGSLLDPYRGVNNASDDPKTFGSEYNDLIYRVCVSNPPSETAPSFATYSLDELGCVGNGGCQWTQEVSIPTNSASGYVCRGNSASDFATTHSPVGTYIDNARGWRPVLELI